MSIIGSSFGNKNNEYKGILSHWNEDDKGPFSSYWNEDDPYQTGNNDLQHKDKISFTIEEIKNYILTQESLGDVLYNLSSENIKKANKL